MGAAPVRLLLVIDDHDARSRVTAQLTAHPECIVVAALAADDDLLVHAVEPGSPAERAGVIVGDLVLDVGGQPVHRPDELLGLLTEDRIGAAVPVRLSRGGQVQEVQVVVGDRPAAA